MTESRPPETYENFPLSEVAAAVQKFDPDVYTFFQKFTCAGCGQRLTIDTPNRLYTEGTCDKCDAVTNIEQQGCNYLLVLRMS